MLDPLEASRRRRIVYHGLRGRLTDPEVAAAVRLCDREFTAEPVFSVQKFVARLAQVVGPARNTGELFASLTRLRMVANTDAIGPDPSAGEARDAGHARQDTGRGTRDTGSNGNGHGRPVAASSEGWPEVFAAVVEEVARGLTRVNPRVADAAFAFLGERLPRLKLTPGGQAEVAAWAANRTAAFTARTAKPDMHAVIHALYVWTCQEVGPIDADKLFARAVREADRVPSAAQCPPQGLL